MSGTKKPAARGAKAQRGSGKPPSSTATQRRRKNFLLSQAKIDRARRILGVATETEAIERALDAVADLEAFRRESDAALTEMVGRGGIVDYFDPSPTSAPPARIGRART